jgi:DNA-binding HxlR family transcriptional regulator
MADHQSVSSTRDLPDGLREARRTRERADETTVETLDRRVEDVLALLGKTHAQSIMRLYAVESGPWRFSELEARIDAAPHTISKRLSELTDAGLLERHAYDENPPRVEYTWTDSARDLAPAFHALYDWAQDYELSPAGPAD